MKKKFALIIALVAFQGLAIAAEDTKENAYGELSFGQLQYKEDAGIDFSPSFVRVLAGKNLNNHFAVEGFFAAGVTDSKKTINSTELSLSVPYLLGAYAKVYANPNDDLEIFARLGTATTNRKISVKSYSATETASSLSYGLGAKYALTQKVNATIDYTTYYSKDKINLSGFTLGVGYNF